MRSSLPTRVLLLVSRAAVPALVVTLAGCSSATDPRSTGAPEPISDLVPARERPESYVALQSDQGDYIGQGQSHRYDPQNALVSVGALNGRLSVRITGDQAWTGEFVLPAAATRLQPGTYARLTRWPFHDPALGGLSWSGEGRGCNRLTGEMTIDSATYSGSTLAGVDLRFDQHCEAMPMALRGVIRWRASDSTRGPGPDAIPGTLWRPPAGSRPTTGDYVYLQSDIGDSIGQGRTTVLRSTTDSITVRTSGATVVINSGSWRGAFVGMRTLTQLQPGYYEIPPGYSDRNPTKAVLHWAPLGRVCTAPNGWFVIDRIRHVAGTLTSLDARFQQHCGGATAALRGAVHWGQ